MSSWIDNYRKRASVREPRLVCKRQVRRVVVSFEGHGRSGAVIPAKAGIHSASHWKCTAEGLDSRFRGNDRCFERDPIPNDATIVPRAMSPCLGIRGGGVRPPAL